MNDENSYAYRLWEENELKKIPISYIVKTQRLYVRIFEIEDGDVGLNINQEYRACQRAYYDYLDKMFFDDKETKDQYDQMLNETIIAHGTYKPICDLLRNRGYEILSKDNATLEQMKASEQLHCAKWKKQKKYREVIYGKDRIGD